MNKLKIEKVNIFVHTVFLTCGTLYCPTRKEYRHPAPSWPRCPVTQVNVAQLFSAMTLLMTDLRFRLKPDVIEAMLVLRTKL